VPKGDGEPLLQNSGASLPQQFDGYVWFDNRHAVTLDTAEINRLPDTYPFGV
jgi:protein-L-isoaspartate(D-aspartate) O-methyltransferase